MTCRSLPYLMFVTMAAHPEAVWPVDTLFSRCMAVASMLFFSFLLSFP